MKEEEDDTGKNRTCEGKVMGAGMVGVKGIGPGELRDE